MNALIYDPGCTLATLTKAFLLARGHRVSIALSEEDVQKKLGSVLFDTLLLCNEPAPDSIAELLRTDFSHVAAIHIGTHKQIETRYSVRAHIKAPFSPLQFERVMEILEKEFSRDWGRFTIPVDLSVGSDRLLCKAVRASSKALLLEAPPETFSPFLKRHGKEEIRATWQSGDQKFSVSAELIFEETSGGRWAGLRCQEGSLESLLTLNSN